MEKQHIFRRIQVLRLLASVLVVGYHAQLTAISYFGGTKPYPLLDMGAYGVDLFFVISGFIIVFIGSTRETKASVFARRRFERVVPLYWIMTALTFALTHIPGVARDNVATWSHLLQSFCFVSWLNAPGTYPVLNVGWTLEYEIMFYIIATIAMAASPRPWLTAAVIMLTLVLTGRGTSFFLQNPIMLEFVFGMTIGAYLYDRRSFAWMAAGTAVVLLTLPWTGASSRVWIFGLPSAGAVALAIYADLRRNLANTLLPKLGDVSFSIYLAHVIAISFICKIGLIFAPKIPVTLVIPLITLFAIAAGYLLYRLIEKRLIAFFHRRRIGVPVRTVGSTS